ncbi:3-phosphoshikimate 1-carboxyvinyltransferase [Rodentibacter pneumotropicus]|uniref:3-phosphoshikimate 1-carboxyvinyltransferase n=1 Tax=Rodentibacter pneumotropicus TaxID=758 RepID=A0A448MMT2_9PAST|nr:3-phosphoshikimate 1-carboxyvinyltransferase [Rodentibacter pneumotropicus]
MAAPLSENDVEIEVIGELVSKPYIDITLAMMEDFGINVTNHKYKLSILKVTNPIFHPVHIW